MDYPSKRHYRGNSKLPPKPRNDSDSGDWDAADRFWFDEARMNETLRPAPSLQSVNFDEFDGNNFATSTPCMTPVMTPINSDVEISEDECDNMPTIAGAAAKSETTGSRVSRQVLKAGGGVSELSSAVKMLSIVKGSRDATKVQLGTFHRNPFDLSLMNPYEVDFNEDFPERQFFSDDSSSIDHDEDLTLQGTEKSISYEHLKTDSSGSGDHTTKEHSTLKPSSNTTIRSPLDDEAELKEECIPALKSITSLPNENEPHDEPFFPPDLVAQDHSTLESRYNTTIRNPLDDEAEHEEEFIPALKFINSLPIDDELFLPPVNRDPAFELPPEDIPLGGTIIIYISEIFSPVHFWFQHDNNVDHLMNDLNTKYENLIEHELAFSEGNIKVGLIVAAYAPEFERWHRAKVIKSPDKDHLVRLVFIDYGTVGMLHMKHIKYLLAEFLGYQRYSHHGRLLNLKPPRGELTFEEKGVTNLLIKIANRPLTATVIKQFPGEPNVYELDVKIVSKGKSENIRDWLIQRSIAVPFELRPKATYPYCYFFPTFAMLEKEYPTFHEKSVMSAEGTDYDLLVEFDNFNNISLEELQRTPKLFSMLGLAKFRKVKELFYSD